MADTEQKTDNTEEKIRQVAKRLFTERGYVGTKIRDVAEAADVNIALLNYYFHSKERLYESIVTENFQEYKNDVGKVLNAPGLSLEVRIRRYVAQMLDALKTNPDLPFFVMNEGRNNPEFCHRFFASHSETLDHSLMAQQLREEAQAGTIRSIDLFTFDYVLHAQLLMPFIQQPILCQVEGMCGDRFDQFLDELKQVVPNMMMAYLRER